MASPKMTSGIFILSTIGAIFGIGSLVVFVFGGKKDPNSIVGEWESGGRVMEFRRGGELVDGKEKGSTKGEWKRIDDKRVQIKLKVRDVVINTVWPYAVEGSELNLNGNRLTRR